MASAEPMLLSMKVAFLVSFTSIRWARELSAPWVDHPPYLIFYSDNVALKLDISSPPKLSLTLTCPKLVSVYPLNILSYPYFRYQMDFGILWWYKETSENPWLLLCCAFNKKAPPHLSTLAKWVVNIIELCYQLALVPLPFRVWGHSVWATATSTIFLQWTFLPFQTFAEQQHKANQALSCNTTILSFGPVWMHILAGKFCHLSYSDICPPLLGKCFNCLLVCVQRDEEESQAAYL